MSSANRPILAGVLHLPPLPGSPRAASDVRAIRLRAVEDARALLGAGFDAAIVENFGDAPFFARRVPPVTVAAMTACAMAVRDAVPELRLGVNVLRNDADAALAIALAVEADFVRINVHIGARLTDQGLIEGEAAATLRTRRSLGAERVQIWADVDVKHSAPLATVPLAQEVDDLVKRGLADAVLVTGEGTGKPVDLARLHAVARAAREVEGPAVLVASGATVETLSELATVADGVIVGSALRRNGIAGGPVDATKASEFARAFRAAFA